MPKREKKLIAKNRTARHEYEILETYEAGIVLTGTEVKSVREDPDRRRKLLLHRRQIDTLEGKLRNKGLSLVALEIYFDDHNRVKVLLGLGRGKKLYDKRADLKKRQVDRDVQRALKERSR